MKKRALWIAVAVLVLLGIVMVFSALAEQQSYPSAEDPIVLEHDPELRRMFEKEQHQLELQEFKIELQYLTMGALEFTIAAFLAGRARRMGK